jgi:hypothetical protein
VSIAEHAEQLRDLVVSVGGWSTTPALSIGGKSGDPGLIKIPIPAAWIRLQQDMPDAPEDNRERGAVSGYVGPNQVQALYAVTIFLPYTDDDNLLTEQFPRLTGVINAVHSIDAPGGSRWRYAGQRIALVYPDRLAYEQHYAVDFVHQVTA